MQPVEIPSNLLFSASLEPIGALVAEIENSFTALQPARSGCVVAFRMPKAPGAIVGCGEAETFGGRLGEFLHRARCDLPFSGSLDASGGS
jgi:hypothetical protein